MNIILTFKQQIITTTLLPPSFLFSLASPLISSPSFLMESFPGFSTFTQCQKQVKMKENDETLGKTDLKDEEDVQNVKIHPLSDWLSFGSCDVVNQPISILSCQILSQL